MAFSVSIEASFITGVTTAADDLTPHFSTYAEELDTRARSLEVMGMQR
jgi:hypothetical protein